jgi:hypothetical protein
MAQLQVKSKYLVFALCGVIATTFMGGWYLGYRRTSNALKPQITTLNTQLRQKTIKIEGQEFYISIADQKITTLKQAKRDGDVRNEELRKLNLRQVNEINRLKFRIDTLLTDVSHNGKIISVLTEKIDSLSHDTVSVKKNAILLPFSWKKKDKWLILTGTFDNVGKLDVNLGLDFKADLWAGVDKTTKKNTAILTTDCKYIKTVSFNSIKLDFPKKKYYGIGLQVGYGINLGDPVKASPYMGVGVSYNFIRF